MRIVEWTIPAYHCPNCLRKIKAVLAEIDGVCLLRSDQSQIA
jgi:copper chaperone CopZ